MKDRVAILTEENICDLLNLYGELNKMLGKNRKCMVIKNTSNYLKRYNGKSLTTGMMNFVNLMKHIEKHYLLEIMMKLSNILEIFPNGWEVNKNPYRRLRISNVRFCTFSNIRN